MWNYQSYQGKEKFPGQLEIGMPLNPILWIQERNTLSLGGNGFQQFFFAHDPNRNTKNIQNTEAFVTNPHVPQVTVQNWTASGTWFQFSPQSADYSALSVTNQLSVRRPLKMV